MNRRFILSCSLLLIISIFLHPLAALAQTQPRQRFDPNATIQGGNTFGGIQFSGVGGALAGCLDVGGRITRGINGLFDKAKKSAGASQEVPVNDQKSIAEEKVANQREACLDGVAYAVAKGLLQQMTNRTLNWVNTGFGGNPFYVRDMDSYLKTISDEQINRFLTNIPDQNPVFGNAIRSIVTQQVSGIQDGLIGAVSDTPEGRAYQAFQEDFTQGGWDSFLNPRNNAVDAVFEASDRLSLTIGNQQEFVLDELRQGDGFLPMKLCAQYEDTTAQQEFIDHCENLAPDERRYSGCTSATIRAAQAKVDSPMCLKYETTTPGSVISKQVAEVTTSSIRQLEQADEINEVLGAFFDQLLNRLFSFGLSSIGDRGGQGFASSGVGTNVVLGTNGRPLSSVTNNTFGTQVGGSGITAVDFDISRPQQLRVILQTQYDYLNRLQDAGSALDRIVPTLGALDYCVPGPNPTWTEGLNENAETYFGSLQEVQRGSTAFSRIVQSIPLIGGLFNSGESHTIAAVGVQLFDKASGGDVEISDTVFHERNRSTLAIFENVQRRYNEVLDYYEANYTKERVKNAFLSVDPANQAFAAGFIEDVFTETSNLPTYSQNIIASGLDEQYELSEQDTRDAIRELESIRSELNGIVATAKARYIAEQAAAGTPVTRSCIDSAYVIDNSPIVPVARQESDTPSPFAAPSAEANTYFYSQL